ncbi:spore germination protein KC [Bacillus pakistanensis]|uniref:Spore germination protein KC n=1 Tax=Rossellomorea pakistanensis TaxID=992288 RepID=A0ABS2NCQ9_9BACI|nr:Ger(x)C family spore germination protein [Bacillus pakistanensis]MBM7585628.1 spore germination protein KC [Bacillus pakistanensis]
MFTRFIKIAICLCLCTLLSGCWNRIELNELAIGIGMGIDKSDGQYTVTFQVVNPGEIAAKSGGGGKTPIVVYKSTGKTLLEAIRRMTTTAPRKIYAAHLRMVVIGSEMATEGISEVLDLLSRDQELRTDFYFAIAKDARAEDVLKVLTPLEDIPSNKLFSSLETSEKAWAPSATMTLDQLIMELVSKGIEAKLTGIAIHGDPSTGQKQENIEQIVPLTQLEYQGLAIFKRDKLIGWLNESESKGLHYALGKVKSTIVTISCPKEEGSAGVEVLETKTDLKATIKDGQPQGNIKIQVEGNVAEVGCKGLDITQTKKIAELEKRTEKNIKDKIKKALKVTQNEYEADAFGFGEAIHRSNPEYWKKNKDDWNQLFTEMPVKVDIDVKIRRIGTIANSPLNEITED